MLMLGPLDFKLERGIKFTRAVAASIIPPIRSDDFHDHSSVSCPCILCCSSVRMTDSVYVPHSQPTIRTRNVVFHLERQVWLAPNVKQGHIASVGKPDASFGGFQSDSLINYRATESYSHFPSPDGNAIHLDDLVLSNGDRATTSFQELIY